MDATSTRMLIIILYYVATYVVTGIISAALIFLIYEVILHFLAKTPFETRSQRVIVGIVERILYTSCVLLSRPEFVAVWLVLKMAGEYKNLEPGEADDKKITTTGKKQIGPAPEYVIVLIGNALSLILGIGTGLLIQQLLPPFPSLRHWQLPLPPGT